MVNPNETTEATAMKSSEDKITPLPKAENKPAPTKVSESEAVKQDDDKKTPRAPESEAKMDATVRIESMDVSVSEYVEVVRDLDKAYGAVNDEHECEEMARHIFTRQAALATFCVNVTFLACGAIFFGSQTDWPFVDVALFTVYTVTSAGYGHVDIPQTPLFQLVDTVYILVGLSLMAIMMAQGYKFIEMEAVCLHRKAGIKAEVLQEGINKLKMRQASETRNRTLKLLREQKKTQFGWTDRLVLFLSRIIKFSEDNPWGDFLYRLGSLVGLAMLGGLPVGLLEQWPWYTCIYWSVVSLTTVGYGDFVPSTVAGKVITTAWLPLNLFFLSILFCSVGQSYLAFSDKQIQKISNDLQKKRRTQLVDAQKKFSTHPFQDVETGDPNAVNSNEWNRSSSFPMTQRYFGANLPSMKEVLRVVNASNGIINPTEEEVGNVHDTSAALMSGDTPNFYLRVKVKERIAFIVANDVAGRHSSLTTGDRAGMLSIFLGGTVEAAVKWMIPRSTRPAFRAVAFEALLYVGESTILNEGVEALYKLSPLEFHRIFSPFLVAMGDKETLQSWLTSTEVLWEAESHGLAQHVAKPLSPDSLHHGHKDFAKSGDKVEFPTNHAEGFGLFQES